MAFLLLLAGACAALALPPVYLFPILPLSLGVLYRAASDAPSMRWAALWGGVFGMGFHTAGLYWLTNAILTRVHDFWWVIPFAAPGVALVIAPLIAIPAMVCRLVRPGWPRVFVFSGVWSLSDMSRALIFSGFPWNPLGSALELPGRVGDILIQPASVIGVHGLSLVLVLASLALWHGRRAVLAVALGSVLWCGYGIWRLDVETPLPVSNPYLVLAQGNVSEDDVLDHEDALDNFRSYLRLTSEGVAKAHRKVNDRSIVVVWPESAFPGLLDEDISARQAMAIAADGAPILAGSDRRSRGYWYNSLEVVSPDGDIEAIYDKSRLVPFGEYQPWILPFNILPIVLTPGPGLVTWDLPQIGRVGPMVCYEIIFSGSVVKSGQRPNWLLTISNDAWYGNSAGPRQHLATGRMRAVEEGLPVVFANNRGVSAVYDSNGHETIRTYWGKEEVVDCYIPSPGNKTLFSYFGNAIDIFISLIFIVFPFIKKIRNNYYK
ncbi:apolipoprotein N-acyltransferase [Saccharibacter sp. 17.LH.SD]|uniref:apolipoprotein N-acyltransferase n=1 Tax=Saccharibacter sp. 17.LH.SD TaxID=2689393 RepID=UPI001F02E2E8|nr:apolipoprotein N-acyltransferase [Saccharibacter sp. 17.LH.SD]